MKKLSSELENFIINFYNSQNVLKLIDKALNDRNSLTFYEVYSLGLHIQRLLDKSYNIDFFPTTFIADSLQKELSTLQETFLDPVISEPENELDPFFNSIYEY